MTSEEARSTEPTNDESLHWSVSESLYSSANVRGSYNPLHFVVRLNPALNDVLQSGPSGFFKPGELDFAHWDAFSTYLHETIHWWQHIGSTTGLMLSLAYPAESHVNRDSLLAILNDIGCKKSLKTLYELDGGQLSAETIRRLSLVLNNWHDGEFNRRIILDPLCLDVVTKSPYFDSVGHSLEIGLGNSLGLLCATFDRNAEFLPDVRKWEPHFESLRSRNVEGYYYGSPIKRMPLGALHIFEGQARFCQLQYLYLSTAGSMSWDEFGKRGMMGDTYLRAFDLFLRWAELDWPATPIDPIVQLFLLVCDLAINPSEGYPFDLQHFESFIVSVDPGFRFAFFSCEIARQKSLHDATCNCSRDEYIETTSVLAKALICQPPTEIASEVFRWSRSSDPLKQLLREEECFDFGDENLPVRLYFAKHIRFAEDRLAHPEFFCWPAMHLGDSRIVQPDLNKSMRLWNRHAPIFYADLSGEIRPILVQGRSASNIQSTFNRFYTWNVLYDIIRQWIISDVPFNYDYAWLTPKYTLNEKKEWASMTFKHAFGVSLDDFELLAPT
jgi:hypothetical protein